MAVFDVELHHYIEEHLTEESNDIFQISRKEDLSVVTFRPINASDSSNLVKSGSYSLKGADAPLSFRFPAIIERAFVGPYGHQVNTPRDNWHVGCMDCYFIWTMI